MATFAIVIRVRAMEADDPRLLPLQITSQTAARKRASRRLNSRVGWVVGLGALALSAALAVLLGRR